MKAPSPTQRPTSFRPSLAQLRAFHASQAARLRRFADENTERGLHHFAALDRAAADREQSLASALSVSLRAALMAQVFGVRA